MGIRIASSSGEAATAWRMSRVKGMGEGLRMEWEGRAAGGRIESRISG